MGKTVIIAIYLLILAFELYLELLNLRHLKKEKGLPPEFEGRVDEGFVKKSRDYLIENTRFGIFESLFTSTLVLFFLLFLLGPFDGWAASKGLPFIASGLLFFLPLIYAEAVVSAPFSLYRAFVIEKRYGFSTMTPALWAADFIKGLIISTIITSVIIAGALWIIGSSPGLWWFWLWCFFLAFSVFMMYISPYVIEPLFHKFEPIEDPSLEEGIKGVLKKAGLRVKKVMKVDASRRTTHTNAYFTGIGSVKRIVLYDTLLESLNAGEITTVLAHEAGHWRKRHLLKTLVMVEAIALAGLFLAHQLMEGDALTGLFGIPGGSFFAKAVILGFIASLASFPLEPLMLYISRRHEKEADEFSYEVTGDAESMASSLIKLSKDNLANLYPHPVYVAFRYSHPPAVERVRRLKGMGGK